MKKLFGTVCFVIGTLLASTVYADDMSADKDKAATYVKDSTITAKVKAKLAADYPSSMAHIKVDTDKDGVVWLSGTAKSQDEADKAVAVAKATEGVKAVQNKIRIEGESSGGSY